MAAWMLLGCQRGSLLGCRIITKMQKRILVYLQRECDESTPRKAYFTQSVVDTFNNGSRTAHQTEVFIRLDENRLMLHDADNTNTSEYLENQKLPLVRSPFCPIHHLSPDQIGQLDTKTLERGIDSGCSIILETCDGYVLLTRRANHLRTFPGVWTPPGGHIEENETLLDAGLREFAEETGLKINSEDCENDGLKVLGLWESTYPPLLTLGLPIRHHIVVYFHAKLKKPYTADRLQSELKLDLEEVGASIWLNRKIVEAITAEYDEPSKGTQDIPGIPEKITITVNDRSKEQQYQTTMETKVLLNRAPLTGADVERISTGTKFALRQWLNCTADC